MSHISGSILGQCSAGGHGSLPHPSLSFIQQVSTEPFSSIDLNTEGTAVSKTKAFPLLELPFQQGREMIKNK
jgi:hypothetical protein